MTKNYSEQEQDPEIELGIARIEIKELKQALAEEREKPEKNLANWQRAQADFANFKRRTDQEKEELGKYANAGLILSLLPFLDDLELALGKIPPELVGVKWVEGVKQIERKFLANLEKQGVVVIKAVGETFDPRIHEAIKEDAGPEGKVTAEVQRGYKLGEKILRPSKVIVGNGETPE